jgi:Uma2 family endonuclease
MSLFQTLDQDVEYPESDGQPMGETDLHIEWIIQIRDILRWRYRGQRVYVASNLLLYYEEGMPHRFVVPDGFVVLDCDPGRRRVYKLWAEGKAPDVVFEVTSLGTKREDEVRKPQTYAEIGVREYFVYDPSAEYLTPPLQGFRRAESGYQRIAAAEDGSLVCAPLGLRLSLDGESLVFSDLETGESQLSEAESERTARKAEQAKRKAEQAKRKAEQAKRQAEQTRREAAEARVAELEEELRRLRHGR